MRLSSVVLSYFLIAGGTFFAGLLAGRIGMKSEYLGYFILALGGFVGGVIAARASHGSTILEPALGAVLLLASFIGLGVAVSGADAQEVLLLPNSMKAIGLTAGASAGGGIAGAFVAEKLFGEEGAGSLSWILYVAVACFGAGIIGSVFGAVVGKGETAPLLGTLALCCVLVGIATGASATSRPLGASFLGGVIGLGGFFYLTIYIFMAMLDSKGVGPGAEVPSEAYGGLAIMAVGGGIATLIGSVIGWASRRA